MLSAHSGKPHLADAEPPPRCPENSDHCRLERAVAEPAASATVGVPPASVGDDELGRGDLVGLTRLFYDVMDRE